MKREKGKPIHKEGTWGLYEMTENKMWRLGSGSRYYLKHYCYQDKGECAYRYTYHTLRNTCCWCGDPVPEGIQGIWIMMTGDMES